ncbi:MAG: hypothetical protein IPP06_05340 [Saprospiraceae bacterium]|nr:hypothetical protein [Candidatus Vicinibacter affinis]
MFEFKWPYRYDLTSLGERMVSKMIEHDGIVYVNDRRVNKADRKGK